MKQSCFSLSSPELESQSVQDFFILMLLLFIDGIAQNSGQMLDNVNQTHLVLASAKLLLQKPVQFFRNHHKQTNLFGSSNPNQSWKGTIDILVGTKRAVGSSITKQDLEIFVQASSTRMIWLKLWLPAKSLQRDSMSWPRNLCPWITHSQSTTWGPKL